MKPEQDQEVSEGMEAGRSSPQASTVTLLDEAALRRIVADEVGSRLTAFEERLTDNLKALGTEIHSKTRESDRLLNYKEVAEFLGIDPREVRRLVKEGLLPAPIRLGERRRRWRKAEIDRALREGNEKHA